jgi:hypothetical protein
VNAFVFNKVNRNALLINPYGAGATAVGDTRGDLLSRRRLRGRRLRGRRLRARRSTLRARRQRPAPQDQAAHSPQRRFPPATRSHHDLRGRERAPKIARARAQGGRRLLAPAVGVALEPGGDLIE